MKTTIIDDPLPYREDPTVKEEAVRLGVARAVQEQLPVEDFSTVVEVRGATSARIINVWVLPVFGRGALQMWLSGFVRSVEVNLPIAAARERTWLPAFVEKARASAARGRLTTVQR